MAGCDCRKDIFKISYDTLTTEVASQHKDWTSTQVRQETARLFRPSYRQNMESVKRERGNEKVYPGADFIFEDGKVNFVDGLGKTNILTFHERQRRDTPEEYSPEQHQTSLLIQTAFQRGANEVVTSYPEKNGQRDIVVMKLDRKTGKGTSYIINTAPDGNDHSIPEIQQIAKSRFESLTETKATGAVFVLSDTRTLEKPTERAFSSLHSVVRDVPRTALSAVRNTVGEIAYTARSVDRFFQGRQDAVGATAPQQLHADHMPPAGQHRPADTREHMIKRENPIRLDDQRVTYLDVASAKNQIEKNVQHEVDKSIRRHERKLRQWTVHGESRIKTLTREKAPVKGKRKNKTPVRLETQIIMRRKKIVTEHRVSFKKRIKEIARVERVARKVGRKRITERAVYLLTIAKAIIRGKEQLAIVSQENGDTLSTKQEKSKQRIKELVFSFSISFLFWVFLNSASGKEIGKGHADFKNKENATLFEKAPTPWILYAIIWHLAMIRESGMRTVRAQGQKKKTKRTSYYPSIAPQGVIFAYAS